MELLHVILPNKEERIVHSHHIFNGRMWESDEEGMSYPTKVEVVEKYYAHFQTSKLNWMMNGLCVYVYSLVILNEMGDIVGVKADNEETYVDDEERVVFQVNIPQLAEEMIFNSVNS